MWHHQYHYYGKKKKVRKAGLVTEIRNWNSIVSPYLFNFKLNKDLYIDAIGPKWNPTQKKLLLNNRTLPFMSPIQLVVWDICTSQTNRIKNAKCTTTAFCVVELIPSPVTEIFRGRNSQSVLNFKNYMPKYFQALVVVLRENSVPTKIFT